MAGTCSTTRSLGVEGGATTITTLAVTVPSAFVARRRYVALAVGVIGRVADAATRVPFSVTASAPCTSHMRLVAPLAASTCVTKR
jgi:hypothetical protein